MLKCVHNSQLSSSDIKISFLLLAVETMESNCPWNRLPADPGNGWNPVACPYIRYKNKISGPQDECVRETGRPKWLVMWSGECICSQRNTGNTEKSEENELWVECWVTRALGSRQSCLATWLLQGKAKHNYNLSKHTEWAEWSWMSFPATSDRTNTQNLILVVNSSRVTLRYLDASREWH